MERTEEGWFWFKARDHGEYTGNLVGACARPDGRIAISLNGPVGHTLIYVRPSEAKDIVDVIQEATIEAMAIVKDSTP